MRRIIFNAIDGGGRKCAGWVSETYPELVSEFERLKAASVKLSPAVLRCVAKSLIDGAPHGSPFHRSVWINGTLIGDKVTIRWIQIFMSSHNIVVRRQAGKLPTSPKNTSSLRNALHFTWDS